MNNYDHEVIIIGGGPAGSMAAIYLSGSGFDVCLIEKKIFPRETLCGEFLSHEVAEALRQQNLFDKFLLLNPNPIRSFRLILNEGNEFSANLNFSAFGLRRSTFDNFLLNCAKERGVKVLQPCEADEIVYSDDCFEIKFKNRKEQKETLHSKYVLAAYGKQNVLDKDLKRNFAYKKSHLNGVKFHVDKSNFRNFSCEEIRIYSGEGIYCGLNAVDNNTITVCFLEQRNDSTISSREHLINFITNTKSFQNIFYDDYEELFRNLPVMGTGNIYFGKKGLVENGIFMIGDAAGIIAPLAGDGIGIAIQSAKLIAEILSEMKFNFLTKVEAEKIYYSRWKNIFNNRIITASLIQNIILNKAARGVSGRVLNTFPSLLPLVIKITRERYGLA